jgi:hypothetical protein
MDEALAWRRDVPVTISHRIVARGRHFVSLRFIYDMQRFTAVPTPWYEEIQGDRRFV